MNLVIAVILEGYEAWVLWVFCFVYFMDIYGDMKTQF